MPTYDHMFVVQLQGLNIHCTRAAVSPISILDMKYVFGTMSLCHLPVRKRLTKSLSKLAGLQIVNVGHIGVYRTYPRVVTILPLGLHPRAV